MRENIGTWSSKMRNYKQEYQRRLKRAFANGLSRAQARGHAKPGEALVKQAKAKTDIAKLEAALKILHTEGSLQRAAREAHVSAERFKRYLVEKNLVLRVGRKWQITDTRPREMTVFSNGRAQSLILKDFANASLNGGHLAAIGQFLNNNDRDVIRPFEGQSVTDTSGKSHVLETNPNTLYRIAHAGSDVFEQVYRLIH
jgi:hypothetical protein